MRRVKHKRTAQRLQEAFAPDGPVFHHVTDEEYAAIRIAEQMAGAPLSALLEVTTKDNVDFLARHGAIIACIGDADTVYDFTDIGQDALATRFFRLKRLL